MARTYKAWNGPMATTAAQQAVTTTTAIRTMQQFATSATGIMVPLAWGFSIDDPAGADGVIELIQTDVAATVTAHVAAGIQPIDGGGTFPASQLTLGTSATGYTATVEGTPTATRTFDAVSLSSTSAEAAAAMVYVYQWMPDERMTVPVSKFLRVRATTPTTAVDLRSWVVWSE